MPTEQLFRIKSQLSTKELTVSDGLLLTLRALRGHMPENRLLWLNRELLGYRPEDLEEFSTPELRKCLPAIVMLWSPARKQHEEEKLDIASLSLFAGTWGKLDESGGINNNCSPSAIGKEYLLQYWTATAGSATAGDGGSRTASLFSMSHELETGAEFYCFARELSRIAECSPHQALPIHRRSPPRTSQDNKPKRTSLRELA